MLFFYPLNAITFSANNPGGKTYGDQVLRDFMERIVACRR